jgi:hypothetical protein
MELEYIGYDIFSLCINYDISNLAIGYNRHTLSTFSNLPNLNID